MNAVMPLMPCGRVKEGLLISLMALALDTLAQAKRLQEAGFNEKQAEALTAALRDAAAPYDISALATKADLAAFATKADLAAFATKADLTALKAELAAFATKADLKADLAAFATKADLATFKADLIQWIVGLVAGAVVLNVFVEIGGMFGMAKLLGH